MPGDEMDEFEPREVPEPPGPLAENGPGAAFWGKVWGEYDLNLGETQVLFQTCRVLDEIAELETALAGEPFTVKGSMGQSTLHPLRAQLHAARKTVAAFLRQLALPDLADEDDAEVTPMDRSRVNRRNAMKRYQGRYT